MPRPWILFVAVLSLIACGGPSARPAEVPAVNPVETPTATADAGEVPDAGGTYVPRALPAGPMFRQTAEDGDFADFELQALVVKPNGTVELPETGALDGTDPVAAGTYSGHNYYNGGAFKYGTATSREHVFAKPFDEVVPSFEVLTPPGTWAELKVSVRVQGEWSRAYELGVWSSENGPANVSRHSVRDGSGDAIADIRTDTLRLKMPGDGVRLIVTLFSETPGATPTLRGVAANVTLAGQPAPVDPPNPQIWGTVLDVPLRSQMIYPGGGQVWCSPTSLTMLLEYWSQKLGRADLSRSVPQTVSAVDDFIFGGKGNWAFNTAHAASIGGGALRGMVVRLSSMAQLERLIGAGVPVAISFAFKAGELTGAPINSTNGHILVVRGFTATGDVRCNDPAFPDDATVAVTYARAELEKLWLGHSRGATYLVWPTGSSLPVDPLGGWY